MPDKPGPRTGSTTPIPLIAWRERGLQGSLTEGERLPCGPRDVTGEGVNKRRLPRCNDGCSYAPLHYAGKCDRTALPDLDKAPLTGHVVPLAGATQGRQGEALQTRDVGPGGQDRR